MYAPDVAYDLKQLLINHVTVFFIDFFPAGALHNLLQHLFLYNARYSTALRAAWLLDLITSVLTDDAYIQLHQLGPHVLLALFHVHPAYHFIGHFCLFR